MRATQSLLKHIPSIKFVGGPHVKTAVDSAVKPHFGSGGLVPNGEGTLQISQLMEKWPKLVIASPPPKATSQPVQQKPSGLKPSDKPYDYTSVFQLPRRFQSPVFDEAEIEAVNGGGAGVLI
ncbi:hypothetical protein BN1211_4054 [Cyberlindnera jadinii]|uniref:Uncharacterized protein n=1 Tax=Cyberlindnera jadinii (strain ATCC 18201 / CBS 1600 / BCRC 20928 / JCM 3617 / NBRC 0987 / NRRL Y-1542) TaxID=983966 RepID=A0A0H5C613_CYBJN|nr:hypothetical protein BN1211_4054 [Cyberlindnera jadinii]